MKLTQNELKKLIKEVISEISFVDALDQRMRREKKYYDDDEEDFDHIDYNTPELQQMFNSLEVPEEKDSPWAPGTSPKEDNAALERVRQTLPKIIENPKEYQWDDRMYKDLIEYITWIRDNPEDPKDTELGGIFLPGGFLDLRKKFPSLFKSTKLRRELGLDSEFEGSGDAVDDTRTMPGFKQPKKSKWKSFKDSVASVTSKFGRSGSEDVTKPGFRNRHESVEKLTPEILRELIKEEIDNKLNEIDPGLISLGAEVFGDPETMRAFGTSTKTLAQMVKPWVLTKFGKNKSGSADRSPPSEPKKTLSQTVSGRNENLGFKHTQPAAWLNKKSWIAYNREQKKDVTREFPREGAQIILDKFVPLLRDELVKGLKFAAAQLSPRVDRTGKQYGWGITEEEGSYYDFVDGLYPFLNTYSLYLGKKDSKHMITLIKDFMNKEKILGFIKYLDNSEFINSVAAGYLNKLLDYNDMIGWSVEQSADPGPQAEEIINETFKEMLEFIMVQSNKSHIPNDVIYNLTQLNPYENYG